MSRWGRGLWLALLLAVVVALPARAQSLSEAQCAVLKQLGSKFGSLNRGTDDQRREFALKVAQQFAFSFPGEGWGSKSAGPGRPPTKDAVARQHDGVLEGWDLVDGTSREVTCTTHLDLTGQIFLAVTPLNHLGTGGTTDPPPPPPQPSGAATADLQQQQLAILLQILGKLDAQLEAQRLQTAALAAAVQDLKAQIAAGVKIRF